MPTYSKSYLLEVMNNLGAAIDFAVNDLEFPLSKFWLIFASSKSARGIERGMPWALVGKSGEELVLLACEQAGLNVKSDALLTPAEQVAANVPIQMGLSQEYWCGYSLAFLQWITGFSFSQIESLLPIVSIAAMYPTYHEQSEERFVEAALKIIKRNNPTCGLKKRRESVGMSQSQLAKESGVGIRAIQQYEQGSKSLRRASYDSVERLAHVLRCKPKDLMYEPSQLDYALIDF